MKLVTYGYTVMMKASQSAQSFPMNCTCQTKAAQHSAVRCWNNSNVCRKTLTISNASQQTVFFTWNISLFDLCSIQSVIQMILVKSIVHLWSSANRVFTAQKNLTNMYKKNETDFNVAKMLWHLGIPQLNFAVSVAVKSSLAIVFFFFFFLFDAVVFLSLVYKYLNVRIYSVWNNIVVTWDK